jgi:hypothetical protein
LFLVGGNDGRTTEPGDDSSGAVVAALSGAFLELSWDVDGQDGGDESGKEGELHDDSFAKIREVQIVKDVILNQILTLIF